MLLELSSCVMTLLPRIDSSPSTKENNAKKLIKNYIEKIGELSNTNYEVQFEIIESLEK